MATNRDPFEKLTEDWEPKIRAEFLSSVQGIKDKVVLKALIEALEAGDITAALETLRIDKLRFQGLSLSMQEMFTQSGLTLSELVPALRTASGSVVEFVFDARNLQAEAWIKSRSLELITDITQGQIAQAREHMATGLENGWNPRKTALDLIGRIDRKTGSRTGGVLGLAENQKDWQKTYRANLESGNAADLRNALGRDLRDRRFDSTIKKAIKTGEPIPAATREKMIVAYQNKSLRYRGQSIAREETAKAIGESHKQVWDQAIDRGQVKREEVYKYPRAVDDDRRRQTHRAIELLNKDGVQWDQPYKVPAGMEPQMHAPYKGEPLCRCNERVRLRYNR